MNDVQSEIQKAAEVHVELYQLLEELKRRREAIFSNDFLFMDVQQKVTELAGIDRQITAVNELRKEHDRRRAKWLAGLRSITG